MTPPRMNLGCGRRPIPGYVNVDIFPGPGVDVVADVQKRLPFDDGTFEEVYASHVLEHVLDLPLAIREIHRVLKSDGLLVARVPFGLRGLYEASHYHAFSLRTMRAFAENNEGLQNGRFFQIEAQDFTDWEMPLRWYVRKYLPRLHRVLVTSSADGKERLRAPLGRRKELTLRMRKISPRDG
ncbi:MAG TPA: class I SAM-dependent methyltransferase [Thermoplasmata archaeon]|nr:class I SAM-dependent methyltransferase [Thermoplasmata archaeon]